MSSLVFYCILLVSTSRDHMENSSGRNLAGVTYLSSPPVIIADASALRYILLYSLFALSIQSATYPFCSSIDNVVFPLMLFRPRGLR